nr:hypothetical protein [uncultured Helicobacter sp.]
MGWAKKREIIALAKIFGKGDKRDLDSISSHRILATYLTIYIYMVHYSL